MKPWEGNLIRFIGLLTVFAAYSLALTSFRPLPESAVAAPDAVRGESRLAPLSYTLPIQYAQWVIYYCDETGVPVWLASRMFDQESQGWRPWAVSWAGAQGLAQLMPANLASFARLYNGGRAIDPHDPETAIRVGIRYLADLHAATGSWRIALMSYNGGIGHHLDPRRYGDWEQESRDYVRAILGE